LSAQTEVTARSNALRLSSSTKRAVSAAAVFCVTVAALMATDSMYGITYDEPIYTSKATQALEWLRLLIRAPGVAASGEAIDSYWHAKDEHPGFSKLVTAVSGATLGKLVPYNATWRTGTNLLCACCFAGLYLFVAALWGGAAAIYAVSALLLMPRVFAHCHLAALDAPIMSLSFLTVVAAWKASADDDAPTTTRTAWARAAFAGALWGLALGTKLNAFFLPFVVFPWALLFARKHLLKLAVCFGALGPVVFVATWPWLWHSPWARFVEYFQFHFRHDPVSVLYFGKVYALAPWHYALVMSAITLPPATGLLALVGVARVRWLRRDLAGVERTSAVALLLVAWALLVNLGPSCLPSSPKYSGVRLFLPIFPYVAILAAVGFRTVLDAGIQWAARRVDVPQLRPKLTAVLLFCALVGPLAAVAKFTPYHLSYYNLLIGGLPGAARRGMEPTYWGDTYRSASLWLAAHAPEGATVWIEPLGFESTVRYFELGPLRPDLRFSSGPAGFATADFAVTQNKPTEMSDLTKRLVATTEPVYADGVDGVPLIYVLRPRAGSP